MITVKSVYRQFKKWLKSKTCFFETSRTESAYRIVVTNTTQRDVPNVYLLAPAMFLYGNCGGAKWEKDGSLLHDGIKIESKFPTVTYQQVLCSIMSRQRKIHQFELYIVSGKERQIIDIFTIYRQGAGGETEKTPIIGRVDPYAVQKDMSIAKAHRNIYIDGLTALIFETIYANTKFEIDFIVEIVEKKSVFEFPITKSICLLLLVLTLIAIFIKFI